MVRKLIEQRIDGVKVFIDAYGLSTDEKPKENIVTGSKFCEVNTGKRFMFDETGSGTWYEDETVIR